MGELKVGLAQSASVGWSVLGRIPPAPHTEEEEEEEEEGPHTP
jgi:hypothetical protein